jgi:hypothetical protein
MSATFDAVFLVRTRDHKFIVKKRNSAGRFSLPRVTNMTLERTREYLQQFTLQYSMLCKDDGARLYLVEALDDHVVNTLFPESEYTYEYPEAMWHLALGDYCGDIHTLDYYALQQFNILKNNYPNMKSLREWMMTGGRCHRERA